ncbi:MAG: LPS export ABC transporter periplasmic protein LptC [Candidatus Azobacteroides sp.]|nr:LPS export ABC transporter periplasmic protein LptC [Candidatus Azobacteroides sp.]
MKKTLQKHHFAIVFIGAFCLFSATCSKGKTVMDTIEVDAQALPLMHTENASSLISDSGVTRYRLVAKVWDVYDKHPDSYWYFPKGLYVEKFDSVFNVEGSIKSDTAYYYDKKMLWHLIGNVEVMNLQKEKFETQELFWNEKTEKIYSNKPIRIEQADKIILGEGFESNQSMTNYDIFKTYAVLYVNDREEPENPDEVKP